MRYYRKGCLHESRLIRPIQAYTSEHMTGRGRLLIGFLVCALASVAVSQSAVDHGRNGWWFRSSKGPLPTELEGESEAEPEAQTGDADVHLKYAKPSLTISSASLFGFSGFRGFNSYQVNVDRLGNNIVGDAANEPSMTVDPTNRNRIAVGWRQFDHVYSDFRQGGYSNSSDGGTTWRSHGNLEAGVFRSDPVLATTAEGKFYYLSLKQTFFDDIYPSSNGGVSWSGYSAATGGDKQWMAVDQTSGIGKGNIYQAWSTAGNNYGGRQFSRSTDNGKTWIDPVFLPQQPVWGTLDVAANGDLYLGGLANPFAFLRSQNAKDKGAVPTFDLATPVELGGSIVYGAFINPVGLTGQVWIASDKSKAATRGNIYMLCSVGVDDKNPCDVHFVRSTDGGQTWTAPKRLNDDPRNSGNWHWFGAMSVAPNGRIDVCWYDSRANPGTGISALYYTSSSNGGTTWTPNKQVSQTFDPSLGYPVQRKMGDYLAIVSDNSGASVAYGATFNGEEDVWFLRISAQPSGSGKADTCGMYVGAKSSGDRTAIWNVDGATFDVTSTLLPSLGQAAGIIADYKLPSTDVSNLAIHLTAQPTRTTTGMVWLYNWKKNAYDLLQAFPMSASATVDLKFSAAAPVSNYVDTTGRVRAIFRALQPIRNGKSPVFDLKTDLMELQFG
jgi:hypothetical protein